jgi:hypothetical protein
VVFSFMARAWLRWRYAARSMACYWLSVWLPTRRPWTRHLGVGWFWCHLPQHCPIGAVKAAICDQLPVAAGGVIHGAMVPTMARSWKSLTAAMTSYAVFFCDPAAIGLQWVEAADAAAAAEMVLDQHPDAQVHALDGALVTEENRHRLLVAWVRGRG